MTKSMWIAVFILFLLFSACGTFMIVLQKDEEQKNIYHFLSARKLHTAVSYKRVSLSLANKAVLKRVSLKLKTMPNLPNSVKQFSVREYREKNHIPVFLSFTARDVSFKLQDAAKALKIDDESVIDTLAAFDPVEDILNYPLYAFLLAGCNDIYAQVDGEYHYDSEAKKIRLKTRIQDKCLGIWDADVSLSNISNAQQGRLVLALQHFLKKGSPLNDLKHFLDGATVTNISLAYTDFELVKGYKKYIDSLYLRQPGTASLAELSPSAVRQIVSYFSISNAHRQRNTDIAQTLAQFIKFPGTIRFQSKAGKQVPLSVLNGTFLRQLTDLLLRLDTSVTVEKETP